MKNRITIKWISILSLVAILTLVLVPAALAFEERNGDEVIIPADETVNDDLYASGDTIIVDGTIKGDLVGFARKIVINGTVEGDLLGAAREIEIKGTVTDDVRAAAYSIVLLPGSRVGSDFVGAAYNLYAQKGSAVERSLIYAGFQSMLYGDVTKDVKMAVKGADIQGKIGGNADLTLGSKDDKQEVKMNQFFGDLPELPAIKPGLKLGSTASIGGNLTYTAKETSDVPEGVVTGESTHLLPKLETDRPDKSTVSTPATIAAAWALDSIRFLVSLVIIGLLSVWLIPTWIKRPADTLQQAPLPSLGWGFVTSIGFWVALSVALFVVMLVGITLALLTLGGLSASAFVLGFSGLTAAVVIFLLIACYFTLVIVSYWTGRAVLTRFSPASEENLLVTVLIGVLIIAIIGAIPVLGWLVKIAASLLGLGALFLLLRSMRKGQTTSVVPTPLEPAA